MLNNVIKNNWSREELIVAFNLYCKTPFTKINSTNSSIKELARIIGRSNSAVALKLVNFARLDPALQKRNIFGMSHGSKGEELIWNEFNANWEGLAYESEKILAGYKGNTIESSSAIVTDDLPVEGKERESIIKTRVNQSFFRNMVLASYDNHCCITGIAIPALLVASHIVPWAIDIKSRMNPANGLCLNALHDRAFDKGLITITPDFIIKISDKLAELIRKPESDVFFLPY
ncbi:MAG: hypothetical protein ACD_79C00184G0001, partial [uncultured bacterium]